MKQLALIMTLLCITIYLQSCGNTEEPENVEFVIDYSFFSGSMSRGLNDDAYALFFEENIKTRKITPDRYSLIFTNVETGQQNEINGLWSENNLIRLVTGTYRVTGVSEEIGESSSVNDKVLLAFNSGVSINENTTSIVLKAQYDCSLLLFDASLTSGVMYYWEAPYGVALKQLGQYFYCFSRNANKDTEGYWGIRRKNGNISKIYTNKINLEKGKYYFFNDMSGGFDLDPMSPGN